MDYSKKLNEMSVPDFRKSARELYIPGAYKLKRDELLKAIQEQADGTAMISGTAPIQEVMHD